MHNAIEIDKSAFDELYEIQRETGTNLIQQLIESYLETTPQMLEKISHGISNDEKDAIFMAAHSMKSSSAYVGATVMSELAKQIETLAKDENVAELKPLFTEMQQVYPQIEKLLRVELSESVA